MSFDLAIDSLRGDLIIANGNLRNVYGADEVAQRVSTRLRRQLGEWFLNTEVGIPWYGSDGLLGSKRKDEAEVLIRSVVNSTEGVSRITSFNRYDNIDSNSLTLTIGISTIYGDSTVIITEGAGNA